MAITLLIADKLENIYKDLMTEAIQQLYNYEITWNLKTFFFFVVLVK